MVKPRYFNKIEFLSNNIVKKSFIGEDNSPYKDKFYYEIKWLVNAPKTFSDCLPQIIKYSLKPTDLWIKYKKINLVTLHDLMFTSMLTDDQCANFAIAYKKFFNKCKKHHPLKKELNSWFKKLVCFYIERTYDCISKCSSIKELAILYTRLHININGKKCHSLLWFQEYFKNLVSAFNSNDAFYINKLIGTLVKPASDRITFCHGDLVFSNTFYNPKNKQIVAIDHREYFVIQKNMVICYMIMQKYSNAFMVYMIL